LPDVAVLLAAPSGKTVLLMSYVGGDEASNVTLTFDDAAGSPLPDEDPFVSGTFKPTQASGGDAPPAPAPAPPHGTTMSSLNGGSANGEWKLYVFDGVEDDVGQLAQGWTLDVTTTGGGGGGDDGGNDGGGGGQGVPLRVSAFRTAPTDFRPLFGTPSIAGRARAAAPSPAGLPRPAAPAAIPLGTTVSYKLTRPALAVFGVERLLPGRRSSRGCVSPTRANRLLPACVRALRLRGAFIHRGLTGANSFHFSGWLAVRPLARGFYRLVLDARVKRVAPVPVARTGFRIR